MVEFLSHKLQITQWTCQKATELTIFFIINSTESHVTTILLDTHTGKR